MRRAVHFKLESDLVSILSKHARFRVLGPKLARRSLALQHFQIGMIIPDLLFVATRSGSRSKKVPRVRLTAFDAWVVIALKRHGPVHHEELARDLHSNPDRVWLAIKRLRRYRIVTRMQDLRYALNDRRLIWTAEIVAVEAKLARWTDAITQALSYLSFANRAYVALPKRTVTNSKRVHGACEASGVGLIAVGPGKTEVLVRAKRREPLSPERVWLIWKTLGLRY